MRVIMDDYLIRLSFREMVVISVRIAVRPMPQPVATRSATTRQLFTALPIVTTRRAATGVEIAGRCWRHGQSAGPERSRRHVPLARDVDFPEKVKFPGNVLIDADIACRRTGGDLGGLSYSFRRLPALGSSRRHRGRGWALHHRAADWIPSTRRRKTLSVHHRWDVKKKDPAWNCSARQADRFS